MRGKALGPYRIESELGSGGMGKVYLAEAVGKCAVPRGDRLALKVIHPHLLESPGFFTHRFLRYLVDHAPEEHRETMIENVPLHRDIVAAWEAHTSPADPDPADC
ncbi:MAG: hypothetical protein ACYS99_02730 [Planctomycetota bacterium]|jgi:serine/threonine protein kinase